MQGLTDEPLNDTGRSQAEKMRNLIGDVRFDAVYASPLDRAGETASIISGFDRKDIIIDKPVRKQFSKQLTTLFLGIKRKTKQYSL